MKLSDLTIKTIIPFISGDNGLTPYLSGPKVIDQFNKVGFKDDYKAQNGMPGGLSRKSYVFERYMRLMVRGKWQSC